MANKKYDFIIGVDPGLTGGIAILNISNDDMKVFPMPINTVVKGTKKKPKKSNEIDCQGIIDVLSKVKDKKVLFVIERVTARGGEAPNRAFNFGYGWGYIQGVAWTLGFDTKIVTPQKWKKTFPELETQEISKMRDDISFLKEETKELNEELKDLQNDKKQAAKKDKEAFDPLISDHKDKIKEKKKEISQKDSKLKRLAKTAARELASQKYPKQKDEFKRVKDDGKAEATLISLYGKYEIAKI